MHIIFANEFMHMCICAHLCISCVSVHEEVRIQCTGLRASVCVSRIQSKHSKHTLTSIAKVSMM